MSEYDIDKVLIGRSRAIREVKREILDIREDDKEPVLIIGETGTGKDVVANAIHQTSRRADKTFKAVNCADLKGNLLQSTLFGHKKGAFSGAISDHDGVFKEADGGTLFLDELESMELGSQASLLRVIENGVIQPVGGGEDNVDVRIIAVTQTDPGKLISEEKLRDDLYGRLYVFQINLPPLKERKSDIPILAEHFIKDYTKESGKPFEALTEEQIIKLQSYSWPRNVRELSNVIKRAVIKSKTNKLDIVLPRHKEPSAKIRSFTDEELKGFDLISYLFKNYTHEEKNKELTALFYRWLILNKEDHGLLKKTIGAEKVVTRLRGILKATNTVISDVRKALKSEPLEGKPAFDIAILKEPPIGRRVLEEFKGQKKMGSNNKESQEGHHSNSVAKHKARNKYKEEKKDSDFSAPMSKPLILDDGEECDPAIFDIKNKEYRKKTDFFSYEKFKSEVKEIFEIISLEDVERNTNLFKKHGYIEYDFYRNIPKMLKVFHDWPFDLEGNRFYIFDRFPFGTYHYNIIDSKKSYFPRKELSSDICGSFFHGWHRALLVLYNLIEKRQIKPDGEDGSFKLYLSKNIRRSLRKKVSELMERIEEINEGLTTIMNLSPEDVPKALFPRRFVPEERKDFLESRLFDKKIDLGQKRRELKKINEQKEAIERDIKQISVEMEKMDKEIQDIDNTLKEKD